MGNTIRREPVSSKIPASPNYKFLNITDFRGISVSDNPFELSANTASDMLNLYVDETNTLTTRPRLKLMNDFKVLHPHLTRLLGVYPLSIGYLFHYTENGSYALDIATKTNSALTFYHVDTDTYRANPKVDKLFVFEQNDNIYILSGENYYVITYTIMDDVIVRPVLNFVEGYIPTIRSGGTNKISGTDTEQLNILSNKYKESYFWDGTWNPKDIVRYDFESVDTTDVIKENIEHGTQILASYNKISSFENVEMHKITNINAGLFERSRENKVFLAVDNVSHEIYFALRGIDGEKPFVYEEIELPQTVTQYLTDAYTLRATCSKDGKQLLLLFYDSEGYTVFVRRNDEWYTAVAWTNNTRIGGITSTLGNNNLGVNDSGDIFYLSLASPSGVRNPTALDIYTFDNETATFVKNSPEFQNDMAYAFTTTMSSNGAVFMCCTYVDPSGFTAYLSIDSGKTFETITDTTTPLGIPVAQISDNGDTVLVKNLLFTKVLSGEKQQKLLWNISNHSDLFVLSGSGLKIYSDRNKGIYDVANDEWQPVVFSEIDKTPSSLLDELLFYADDSFLMIVENGEVLSRPTMPSYIYSCELLIDSTTPLLIKITTIPDNAEEFEDYYERKEKFLTSLLSTRFDNNRWFATGNYLFRTINNDPTYIGLQSLTSLGETDENITGFNLVQDNLMVVYKDNYLWAVSPKTYESATGDVIYDYVYQETKNTIGNNAIGASIVSAYSEIPLQIAYDGVYGLKQLSNVYASDRISESLSTAIAPNWLKEDKTVIRKALTLNRLYWTYIILPYDNVTKFENGLEKNYNNITKIYLLDNRTGSWYYWELPIKVCSAFVKDNTTHLTDETGKLFVLSTDDITTEYSTEYYDYGKKIIKWYWKTQILPLGTMNYSKKLIDTTFIFTDTDENDEYGLNYTYYAYRKAVSKSNETTISNKLNYVQSMTKKTLIPRFNFVQLELSNVDDDLNNNKLRLVGLGLKYVLLEGLL